MLMRWKQWCIPKDQAGFLRTYTPRETLRRSAVSYWGPSTGNDNRMDMPWGWSQSSPKWTVEVSNNRGRGWWIIGGEVGIASSVTVKRAQNRGGWRSVSPHVRESKTVLYFGFHAVDSRFQILDSSLCQWKLSSGFQSLVGFRIPWAAFRIPKPLKIPDSASTIFSDSGFRILILLGAKSCTCRGFLCHSACRSRVSESKQASMQASKQLYYTQKKYILHAHYLHFSKSYSRQAVWGRCILTIRHLIQKTFCHRVTYTLTYIRCFTGN